jgi:uncharacterized protein (DUF2235 family)
MPRNVIVLFDGTNNQFGPENTNVVRLAQVLDRHPERQLVYYDPGVGTLPEPGFVTSLGKKVSETFGLAFGSGLVGKVERAYTFLMDFWQPQDRVFLFGFSRGAYTARVLAGMLHAIGLLERGNDNLVTYAMRLFRSVRSRATLTKRQRINHWKLNAEFRRTFARPVGDAKSRAFPVHFLGVWDTVSSVGWIWDPASFPYTANNPSVRTIRHAVAIDERRWFFRQNLFAAGNPPRRGAKRDLKELWFPGVHADVGGGYPESESRLWRLSLEWLLAEARTAGLLIDDSRLRKVLLPLGPEEQIWSDGQHESLTTKWWPAEFFPKWQWQRGEGRRRPSMGVGRHRHIEEGAILDRSVLLRIRDRDDYRPPNLSVGFIEKVKSLTSFPDELAYDRSPD